MPVSQTPLSRPIVILYRPSPRLLALTLVLHAGAAVCAWSAALPVWIQLAVSLLLGGGCWSRLVQHRRLGRPDGRCILTLAADDTWSLERGGGGPRPVTLLPGSFVHPVLVVLRFRCGRGRSLVIRLTRDNADAVNLRRLRVRLLHPRAARAGG